MHSVLLSARTGAQLWWLPAGSPYLGGGGLVRRAARAGTGSGATECQQGHVSLARGRGPTFPLCGCQDTIRVYIAVEARQEGVTTRLRRYAGIVTGVEREGSDASS